MLVGDGGRVVQPRRHVEEELGLWAWLEEARGDHGYATACGEGLW